MTTTDVLTRAVGAWVTEVATKLDAGRLGVLRGLSGGARCRRPPGGGARARAP